MALLTTIKTAIQVIGTSVGNYAKSIGSAFPDLDLRWPSGTSASQADARYCDLSNSIANSATETIDLRSLTDDSGAALLFVEVRMIRIKTTVPLTIAKGGTNGWTGLGSAWSVTTGTDGYFLYVCPTDGAHSTGASNKTIDISNASGGTGAYSIEIVGTTA